MLCFRRFAANTVAVDANRNRENGQILGIMDGLIVVFVRNNDGVFGYDMRLVCLCSSLVLRCVVPTTGSKYSFFLEIFSTVLFL